MSFMIPVPSPQAFLATTQPLWMKFLIWQAISIVVTALGAWFAFSVSPEDPIRVRMVAGFASIVILPLVTWVIPFAERILATALPRELTSSLRKIANGLVFLSGILPVAFSLLTAWPYLVAIVFLSRAAAQKDENLRLAHCAAVANRFIARALDQWRSSPRGRVLSIEQIRTRGPKQANVVAAPMDGDGLTGQYSTMALYQPSGITEGGFAVIDSNRTVVAVMSQDEHMRMQPYRGLDDEDLEKEFSGKPLLPRQAPDSKPLSDEHSPAPWETH